MDHACLKSSLWVSTWSAVVLAALVVPSCAPARTEPPPPKADDRPNVLWVVWDTVRADRLSLYGYEKPTTPRLEAWARSARVFDNCLSTAGSTVPSHASMFTGLLPSEHDTNNDHQRLNDGYTTIAELLHAAGYQTYLFAANPHISRDENFQQGFDVEEHPYDPQYKEEALRIVQAKVSPRDKTTELSQKIRNARGGPWGIKASGELVQKGALQWLAKCDASKPFFIFLNYMEAHRPFLPSLKYRERMIKPEHLERSYEVDRSWKTMWSYTFGLHEYTPEELEVMASTYDATLAELDDLFADLLAALDAQGYLKNTVVILTADHGEHLGEHHMLDHQFALYNPLLQVPLVVYYPPRIAPGRDSRPVANFDIFPTILELTRTPAPAGNIEKGSARSLVNPAEQRLRVAEYPAVFREPFKEVRKLHPDWNPTSWVRTYRALFDGPDKFIVASDGEREFFHLSDDQAESRNLLDARPEDARRLDSSLTELVKQMAEPLPRSRGQQERSDEQTQRLKDLGYVADESEEVEKD